MTLILGINAFHADASAALIQDGRIIGAVEEERFTRIKHWAGFPKESIRWCLSEAGVEISDIDHIAINTKPNAHQVKRLAYVFKTKPHLRFMLRRWKNKRERNDLREHLANVFPTKVIRSQLHFIEHHRAHLASAFYPSSFIEAAILSVDGFGDFASGAWGYGCESSIEIQKYVFFPHSLGAFYTAITQYLGFPNYGDEYKVMGLAPYGEPLYLNEMKRIVKLTPKGGYELDLRFFQHSGKKDLDHQWSSGSPIIGRHWSDELIRLLGEARLRDEPLTQRHMDIAKSAQRMYEDALFHVLKAMHEKYRTDNLCIAGGCGANSVANGKIRLNTGFRNIFIQAAAGDAGGALGAALEVWHKLYNKRCPVMTNAYLGFQAHKEEISNLMKDQHIISRLEEQRCVYSEQTDTEICRDVALAISKGLVVGWFEGRMEWGPRALGHRSILGDPRRADMKDILNVKIKRRESFRPFAPSILRESVHEWFESDAEVPFMMQVFLIRKEKRDLIPAVTHIDGSGRLQTVTEGDNQRYYSLIQEFKKLTGVPMILNTSFNENEPIVRSPQEALNCFLRTNMDILVLENFLIKRMQ
jgi:carbamoyltransferase